MTYAIGSVEDFAPARPRRSRTVSPQALCGALTVVFSLGVAACILDVRPVAERSAPAQSVAKASTPVASKPVAPKPVALPDRYAALVDPALSQGYIARPLGLSAPLGAGFVSAEAPATVAPPPLVAMATPTAVPAPATASAADQLMPLPPQRPEPVVAQLLQTVPLPIPRPSDLDEVPSPPPPRIAPRQIAQRLRAPAAPADNRTFFEKIFGLSQPSGPLLAYAAPEGNLVTNAERLAAAPPPATDRQTAVYDIAAHTVYMPNGERLEAHSGLGDRLDDPRRVGDRNRGPTPPHVYDLALRERLFHGVQALRLNPVGGGGVFGRTGLLAHTYMLGPNGDSNGCVSFRNYDAFLQAFHRGEVRRLVVVARQ